MVPVLGPSKFYGSSLPRLRLYTDVKLNEERIDLPLPVMDPLMAWAEEAHWSMGGTCTKRHRFQGRIEGNVNKLRVQRDALFKRSANPKKSMISPAVTLIKVQCAVGLVDEEEEEEENEEEEGVRRGNWGRISRRLLGKIMAAVRVEWRRRERGFSRIILT